MGSLIEKRVRYPAAKTSGPYIGVPFFLAPPSRVEVMSAPLLGAHFYLEMSGYPAIYPFSKAMAVRRKGFPGVTRWQDTRVYVKSTKIRRTEELSLYVLTWNVKFHPMVALYETRIHQAICVATVLDGYQKDVCDMDTTTRISTFEGDADLGEQVILKINADPVSVIESMLKGLVPLTRLGVLQKL